VTRIDALLILVVVIWGANFSVVKAAIQEVPPQAFNAVRMVVATATFALLLAAARRFTTGRRGPDAGPGLFDDPAPLAWNDWVRCAVLGAVGHFVYQVAFISGVARTSVANSSLILGSTPVAVGLLSAALGHERIGRAHWAGAALSVCGIYLIAGRGASLSSESAAGDLLMLVALACWSIYTVGSKPLLKRHSALVVTGWSMAFGTALYVAVSLPQVLATEWATVSRTAWAALVGSALLALNLSYLIWYMAVQRIGSARTSIASNLVPVAAMIVAVLWLGETVGGRQLAGAAAVLSGVAITRLVK